MGFEQWYDQYLLLSLKIPSVLLRSLILEFLPSSCQKYYLGNNNKKRLGDLIDD